MPHTDSSDSETEALDRIANAIRDLGNGDAGTQMGAVEAFSVVFKDSFAQIAEAIDRTDDTSDALYAIAESINNLAEAVKKR